MTATETMTKKKTFVFDQTDLDMLENLSSLLRSSETEAVRRSIRLLALLRRWEDEEGEIILKAKNGESRQLTIL
jgi:hypothetical protein